MNRTNCLSFCVLLTLCAVLLPRAVVHAQERQDQGKPIGKVSVVGKLIVMDLNQSALGRQNLFNLSRHTLRFTPEGNGYRVENLPVRWNADFGEELSTPEVSLHNFSFPFSGKSWDSFSVGVTGSIRFGPAARSLFAGAGNPAFVPRDQGGVSIARFDQLAEAAGNLVNTVPAICVFFKPRMSGVRYVKELDDRVVVTWDLTEPYGNIQDFTWTKTINRFQAVLHKDGTIEMSYQQLAAKDAIIGVYPLISGGTERNLATLPGDKNSTAAVNLDLRNLQLSVVDGLFLKVRFETSGPVLPEGGSGLSGIAYRVYFNTRDVPRAPATVHRLSAPAHPDVTWTIFGFAPRNRANGRVSRYVAFGPGISRRVETSGNTISIQGILPSALRGAKEISVSADASASDSEKPVSQILAHAVALSGIRNPEVHFSSLKPQAGPFPIVYEAFHYYALPNNRDLACTVIKTLGDKFDFLAYYSDFRVDNQEAGTPSDGPLGAVGGAVTGIGAEQRGLGSYCSQKRFQWGFIQPVYSESIQMQEYPPPDAPIGNDHDITFYQKQLGEISQDGKMPPYMYAMSQIGHEMGHRWAAFVSAKVGSETIPLGPTHWARGLQARVPFPYARPTEASIMGGGVWQDNFDGTYTQLDDDYYVPATGYSYLDLYLMGLISPAEVPGFFILRNLVPAGKDANGHPIFKADRTKVTIQDVISAEGPCSPDVEHSQRHFNTGIVVVVQHGLKPSRDLIERANGIRTQWMKYFSITTGRRASMTANPN
ncbi:MAG TPA: hypothetical protein VJN90_10085 [Candidatus Acidoferrales bacterium]|nr:hypothetical protein [Candidatus Acidoferrales bacterium]